MKIAIRKRYLLYTAFIGIALILAVFIYKIRKPLWELLTPVFFALLITYLLNPIVNFLEEKEIPRGVGIIIVYVVVSTAIGISLTFFIPELITSIKELTLIIPIYFEKYTIMFYEFVIRYQHSDLPIRIKEILNQNINNIQQSLIGSLQTLVETMTGAFSFIFDIILGIVISFYMLKDMEQFKKMVKSLIPRKSRDMTLIIARDIDVVLAGFIRGQLLVALILSILTTSGLWFLDIRHTLILGIIAGLSNIIPYFGPILGAIPAVIVALLQDPIKAIWVVLLYVIIQQLESAVFSPKIVGSRVGIHPIVTIMAVVAGGKFFGLFGLLISVPIAGIIKVLLNRIIKSLV